MPAICSTFFGTRAATMPAPRGAGINRTCNRNKTPGEDACFIYWPIPHNWTRTWQGFVASSQRNIG
jgi:hypothetical protein